MQTLQDFVRPSGRWPSMAEFESDINRILARGALGGFEDYVQLLPVRPKIVRLYQDLTSVVRQLLPSVDLTSFEFPAPDPDPVVVPVCGVERGTTTMWFPNVPARQLRELTRKIPEARKPHPVTQFFDEVPVEEAQAHLEFYFGCRRYLLPVIHDTMLRLLFRGLPTRSKFWFLQDSQSDIVCCEAPGCNGVETEQHLLFGCNRVQVVWSVLLPAWRRVTRTTLGWKQVLLGLSSNRLRLQSARADCVKIVWTVLCSVVLHHVWSTRNRWVFEQRDIPPSEVSVKVVLSVFASHLRYLERIWCKNEEKSAAITWLRQELLRSEPYASYYGTHPELLKQRQPTITQCWLEEPRRR